MLRSNYSQQFEEIIEYVKHADNKMHEQEIKIDRLIDEKRELELQIAELERRLYVKESELRYLNNDI